MKGGKGVLVSTVEFMSELHDRGKYSPRYCKRGGALFS